jgi:acyl transferase domain-containing protein
MGTTEYGDLHALLGPMGSDAYNGTGGSHAAAAGRLSYLLGIRGPSLAVDTACSSSLVSVHLAMTSLRSGESDIALASGITLNFAPDVFISLCKARMLSLDGRCKVFDAGANGYVRGEGCGVLVLKRLSDAVAAGHNVLALPRGSATNHNGRSSGLTVPSGPAQQEVIRTALRNAGVDPSEIGYLEAHGTGTAVGDPIEAGALGAVFAGRPSPLLVGSVKTNCGHLEWAAGVCGLIKVILSMDRGVIPMNLHFRRPNPLIPWDKLPIRIVTEPTPWPAGKRIAGVSLFGFGGTNAHVIVEQAPARPHGGLTPRRSPGLVADRPMHLLTLSTKSEAALRQLAGRVAEAADRVPSEAVGDFCYSANTGRSQFDYRLATPARSNRDLAAGLREFADHKAAPAVKTKRATNEVPGLAMQFTGQGPQRPGMGRELYETQPVFRRALEQCGALLRGSLDRPLLDLLCPESGPWIDETKYTQPALFAIEYALAQLWQSWGVVHDAVLGHSVGEYVAACIAGVFDLADALKLIAARGRLMQALPHDGAMFAVRTAEARVAPLLEPFREVASIAAVNGPNDVVISGQTRALESIAAALTDQGVHVQRLNVSHAFHSPLMEPMLEEFAAVASAVPFRERRLTLISNVTESEVGEEIAQAGYWVRHVRQTVRFADSIQAAAAHGCGIFLEARPQPVLCGMGRLCLPSGNELWLPSLYSKQGDWAQILDSAAELWVRGGTIDWDGFDHEYPPRKIALPTYPFERQRYWFPSVGTGPAQGRGAVRPLVDSLSRSPLVKETVISASLGVANQAYLADHKVHWQARSTTPPRCTASCSRPSTSARSLWRWMRPPPSGATRLFGDLRFGRARPEDCGPPCVGRRPPLGPRRTKRAFSGGRERDRRDKTPRRVGQNRSRRRVQARGCGCHDRRLSEGSSFARRDPRRGCLAGSVAGQSERGIFCVRNGAQNSRRVGTASTHPADFARLLRVLLVDGLVDGLTRAGQLCRRQRVPRLAGNDAACAGAAGGERSMWAVGGYRDGCRTRIRRGNRKALG